MPFTFHGAGAVFFEEQLAPRLAEHLDKAYGKDPGRADLLWTSSGGSDRGCLPLKGLEGNRKKRLKDGAFLAL